MISTPSSTSDDLTARRFTSEELLGMPDAVGYELDEEGRLSRRDAGTEASFVGGRVFAPRSAL